MIVADTNLIVNLLLPGEHTTMAERVFGMDAEWCAPVLWQSEFRNVLARRMRVRMADLEQSFVSWRLAAELLSEREFQANGEHVLRLASASGCTAYDCEFVAVARDLAVPLVTFDREVAAAFPRVAVAPDRYTRRRVR
jgi:predicted nucleic acid-binding protein